MRFFNPLAVAFPGRYRDFCQSDFCRRASASPRRGRPSEFRVMPTRLPSDVIAYLVIEDFGELGRAFVETDLAQADRETIIRNFISGQYESPSG
jgi:hypothetical protein